MELCSLLLVFLWVSYHFDHIFDFFFNFVDSFDVIQPLLDILGSLDLKLVFVSHALAGILNEPGQQCD